MFTGGKGGRGGDVIFVASRKVYDLGGITTTVRGEKGGAGTSKTQVGSRGRDKLVLVPVGTVVRKFQKREQEPLESSAAIAELADDDWTVWENDEAGGSQSAHQGEGLSGEEAVAGVAEEAISGTSFEAERNGALSERDTDSESPPSTLYGDGPPSTSSSSSSAMSEDREQNQSSADADGLYSADLKSPEKEDDVVRSQRGVPQDSSPSDGNETSEPSSSKGSGSHLKGPIIADLTEEGQTLVAAVGGCGGRGNTATGRKGEKPWFKRKVGQLQINEHETGEHGQRMWLELELKVLADVGLGKRVAGLQCLMEEWRESRCFQCIL